MNYDIILSLDPSGNFNEGKGTTGWCIYDCVNKKILEAGSVPAKDYPTIERYWLQNVKLCIDFLHKYKSDKVAVVCEDYLVYGNKATTQTYSRMETPKLIGVLQYWTYMRNIPFFLQRAVDVKNRWSNDILIHKGIIAPDGKGFKVPDNPTVKPTRHTIDAIRHAVHFATFKNGDSK